MTTSSYRLLRPRKADGHAPYVGLIISDSFTNLLARGRSYECMGDILDEWYSLSGQVVIGIAVGGAAFTAHGRKRYATIVRWVAEQGISVPWTLLLSMGNDVYQREPSKDINRSKVKAICCR